MEPQPVTLVVETTLRGWHSSMSSSIYSTLASKVQSKAGQTPVLCADLPLWDSKGPENGGLSCIYPVCDQKDMFIHITGSRDFGVQ